MIVTAYHGTSRKNAKKILTEGFRIEKGRQRYPNDLGHGIYGYLDSSPEKGDVYFMQTAKENALLFAKQIRKVPAKQIVVLKLTIQIDIQNYLDLNQLVNRNHVLHLYQKIIGGVLRDIKKEYVSDRISRRRRDGVWQTAATTTTGKRINPRTASERILHEPAKYFFLGKWKNLSKYAGFGSFIGFLWCEPRCLFEGRWPSAREFGEGAREKVINASLR